MSNINTENDKIVYYTGGNNVAFSYNYIVSSLFDFEFYSCYCQLLLSYLPPLLSSDLSWGKSKFSVMGKITLNFLVKKNIKGTESIYIVRLLFISIVVIKITCSLITSEIKLSQTDVDKFPVNLSRTVLT